jgi:hypothetical protein
MQPTEQRPADLARILEQYDQEDWFDFLDRLDEVFRKRRERDSADDPPVPTDRDGVAAWVARQHLLVDPSLSAVWFLPENAPDDEIRLLEISERMELPWNDVSHIQPTRNPLGAEFSHLRLFTADVTNHQFDKLVRKETRLPAGWSLENAKQWRRRS